MNKEDAKSLIIFRTESANKDPLTCYNQWVATMTHKIDFTQAKEAYFLCSLPKDTMLTSIIKEDKI